jgi:hypothetical protein
MLLLVKVTAKLLIAQATGLNVKQQMQIKFTQLITTDMILVRERLKNGCDLPSIL